VSPGPARDLASALAARLRLEYQLRSDSLAEARRDLRAGGAVPAAIALAKRFAGNNRAGFTIMSGRLSLGIVRPPGG
jgi:hypothetical protein